MGTRKILVVDDDPSVPDLFRRALESPEYEVRGAADGVEALEFIRDTSFDMCIIDLMMPRMGGMALLTAIREHDRDMIVFIITGYASEDTARKARDYGCRDYITKPFDIEEFKTRIREAFEARDRGLRDGSGAPPVPAANGGGHGPEKDSRRG